MNRKIIMAIILVIAIGTAVCGWLFLPDTVASKYNLHGEVTSTMPKPLVVVLFFVLTAAGGIIYGVGKTRDSIRGLALSAVGVIVTVAMILMNR